MKIKCCQIDSMLSLGYAEALSPTGEAKVAVLTIRNLPDEVKRALQTRAKANGRSMEAEARIVLTESVKSQNRLKLGTVLSQIGQEIGLTEEEAKMFQNLRDQTPATGVVFE